jgi:hypothetical protein
MGMLNPGACRQARAALRWSRQSLGAAASLSSETIRGYENGRSIHQNHLAAITVALEDAGVEFVDDGGGRLCVHFDDSVTKTQTSC